MLYALFAKLKGQFLRLPRFVRYWIVNGVGTAFSFPMYLTLMYLFGAERTWASRISSGCAQTLDFFMHKRGTFEANRYDPIALGVEVILYASQALIFAWEIEPYMLEVVDTHLGYGVVATWAIAHVATGSLRFVVMKYIFSIFHRPETYTFIRRITVRYTSLTITRK